MLSFGVDEKKRLYLAGGVVIAGEKGTAGSVTLPTTLSGVAVSGLDDGNAYVKYGTAGSEVYEEIALDVRVGEQSFDIPDAVFDAAGTVVFWCEFTGDDGAVVVKTSPCSVLVGESETYVAPEVVVDGGGDGE